MQCTFNAAVTPTVRAEGLTELLGDIVLNCTGGTSTANGSPVPAANITVFLSNANITSRITSDPFTEVLLIVDEPHNTLANQGKPLTPCTANLGICSINGVGSGSGTYDGTTGRPNVFQARQTGANQVTFFGVPIDPPGTSGTRTIRITNVRANANMAGVSSSLVPQTITAFISVNPPNLLPLNNPQQTVAFVARGLSSSVQNAQSFVQCIAQNLATAKDSSVAPSTSFTVRFDEGFPSAWKERNIAVHQANTALGAASATWPATDAAQDIPGANYFSESGFLVNGNTPAGTVPSGYGVGSTGVGSAWLTAAGGFPTTGANGIAAAGVANAGTRLYVNFGSIPNGAQVFVPNRVNLTIPAASTATTSGFAVLVSGADANGAGGSSAVTSGSGWSQVSVTGGTGLAVYEVLFTDPFNNERINIGVAVAYNPNVGSNLPQPGLQSTVAGGYAPISSVGTASSTAPIPRFAPGQTPLNSFIINKCSCNILFPFVTNQQGFDTGIAIANTTVDPYNTTPQAGLVTLNYYGTGGPTAGYQTTTSTVPGGAELLFTLSGGGNYGIVATPGFQGYIIAVSQFQYCHAFAYVSAQGALPNAPGASEGYLGIVLDAPFLNLNTYKDNTSGVTSVFTAPASRTGQNGEVQAH